MAAKINYFNDYFQHSPSEKEYLYIGVFSLAIKII